MKRSYFKKVNRMKVLGSPFIVLALLLGITSPASSQIDFLAVDTDPGPAPECVNVTVRNLSTTTPYPITSIELAVFRQDSCNILCITPTALHRTIPPCSTIKLKSCCPTGAVPAVPRIYRIRLYDGTVVVGRDWLFVP